MLDHNDGLAIVSDQHAGPGYNPPPMAVDSQAGRMNKWVEWGVRRTWGDIGSVAEFERDRRTAERCAREWPGTLVSRTVTADEWTDAGD
jgi:hypothetical protein